MINVPKGQYIDLPYASILTAEHRLTNPAGTTLSECFDADLIRGILDQPSCTGIRIYFAKKEGQPCAVLVGCDNDGNDLFNGHILEMGQRCPNVCPLPNPLNV